MDEGPLPRSAGSGPSDVPRPSQCTACRMTRAVRWQTTTRSVAAGVLAVGDEVRVTATVINPVFAVT